MNRIHIKLLTLVLVAAGVLTVATLTPGVRHLQAADAPAPSKAKPALTVTTAQVSSNVLPVRLSANGNVLAWQEASIGAEANGLRVLELHVNVGDMVKRGQLLARFAPEMVQADVAQARAALGEATANAAEATANAERARSLAGTGALSAQQINQYLTAELSAKARTESGKANLDIQLLRLKNTQVLAPDSGIISARSVSVGAVVANGTELFRLIRQGRLEWRAELPSAELGQVRVGNSVTVTAPNGDTATGRVRMVAPTVDAQTRSGLVYVDINPGKGAASFKPGMFARGGFELGSSNALTIAQQSVVVRDGFSYAFQVKPDGRVAQIKLRTGRRVKSSQGDVVEVLEGLSANSVVVASGAGFLNDGDLVKVVADPVKLASAAIK